MNRLVLPVILPRKKMHIQDEILQHSLQAPDAFWAQQAEQLHWHRKPDATLRTFDKTLPDGTAHASWEWFPGGELSTCYNCVDRHVLAGRGDNVAIYYDSPVTKTKTQYTYRQLLEEVETLAGALRQDGVKKGDVVMVYMPMIPAALIGIMAINRLGAIHSVVFGGFAGNALAQRIDACRPVMILTASCGIDGSKPPIPYRPLVEEALRLAGHRPRRTIIWQREELRWGKTDRTTQSSWQKWVRSARDRGIRADCVPVKSSDPVYIIHTSGTTGAPKGVCRDSAGHAVGLNLSISYLFNIHGPGDVICTASDIGWVVGHSYIVYAPLLAGAATVLYEGKPVGTPDASSFWRLVEEYKVNAFFTAPTALRAIRRDDPDNKFFTEVGKRNGLRSLKALFLAGERSEPSLISMYQDLLDRYAPAPSAVPVETLTKEIQALVRAQVGAIATLGGLIQGKGMIPKTRSGKTLRRVLRELAENAVHGDFDKPVTVPSTVEDAAAVDVARAKVKEYFETMGHKHKAIEAKAKL
ncbi:hypothetical protein PWT90_10383 [Aphanocladium album]|nr:hypothetical protein PWT90_10383 [Aphanocladium album]